MEAAAGLDDGPCMHGLDSVAPGGAGEAGGGRGVIIRGVAGVLSASSPMILLALHGTRIALP